MHADEIQINEAQMQQLLTQQFPQWAHLPVQRVESAGTDNALFRLGSALVARLPRTPAAVAQVEKEQRWLPWLAPQLPLEIPTPLGQGSPTDDYPFSWSVYAWMAGTNPTSAAEGQEPQAARDLARFVGTLQQLDAREGPPAGAHNFGRGVPLAQRDAAVQRAIHALGDRINAHRVRAVWADALDAPVWTQAGVWLHGDLLPGNLLAQDGRITGVIDFGGLGVGDPACDLLPAWTLFSASTRAVYRAELGVDEATWRRGRGWALSFALIALPYYLETNPGIVALAWHTLHAVLEEG